MLRCGCLLLLHPAFARASYSYSYVSTVDEPVGKKKNSTARGKKKYHPAFARASYSYSYVSTVDEPVGTKKNSTARGEKKYRGFESFKYPPREDPDVCTALMDTAMDALAVGGASRRADGGAQGRPVARTIAPTSAAHASNAPAAGRRRPGRPDPSSMGW